MHTDFYSVNSILLDLTVSNDLATLLLAGYKSFEWFEVGPL